MINGIIKRISSTIASLLISIAKNGENRREKIESVFEGLLWDIVILIPIYTISTFLGLLPLTISVHASRNILKTRAFGLHCRKARNCTIISTILLIGVPYVVRWFGFGISNLGVALAFAAVIVTMHRYAPADIEARPIAGVKRRARLKDAAVTRSVVLMVVAMILLPINEGSWSLLVTIGAIFQGLSIHPFVYKLLGRQWDNYLQIKKMSEDVCTL